MKLLFDNQIFDKQEFGGISRYFVNLSDEFDKKKIEYKIIAPISKNLYLKKKDKNKISLYFSNFPDNIFLTYH